MKDWRKRLSYIVCIIFVLLTFTWIAVAPRLYQQTEIDTLEGLACEVAGIGCVSPESEEDSLFSQERRVSEELYALQQAAGGQEAVDKLDSLRQIRSAIEKKEEHWPIRSLLVLIVTLVLQLALAGVATYLFGQKVIEPLRRKLQSSRDKVIEEVKQGLRGSAKWPKENIIKVLAGRQNEQLKNEIEDFASSLVGEGKVRWADISKLLFQTAGECRAKLGRDSKEEKAVKSQYDRVRKILLQDAVHGALWAVHAIVFYAACAITLGAIKVLTGNLGAEIWKWFGSLSWLLLVGLTGAAIAYYFVPLLVRFLTEKTGTELDDIIAAGIGAPLAIGSGAFGVVKGVSAVSPYFQYAFSKAWRIATADGLPFFLTLVVATWVLIFVFNRLVIYLLERWAARSKQTYDDMLVKMLQVFGTFLIGAGAGAICVIRYQSEIAAAVGIQALLPYSIFVGVITAILGYASREAVENLFCSFLLQVDKPFEIGDRLALESGEVCDVREVGMRGTRLYNVLDNTEISVPNRVLAGQRITNISRPDLQLRISVVVTIPHDSSTIEIVEGMLLDIAYQEAEVDQARVTKTIFSENGEIIEQGEISKPLFDLGRRSLEEHVTSLLETYDKIRTLSSERILGWGGYNSLPVYPAIKNLLEEIRELRQKYGEIIDRQARDISNALTKAGVQPKYIPLLQSELGNLVTAAIWPEGGLDLNSTVEKEVRELAHRVGMDEEECRKSISKAFLQLIDPTSKRLGDAELHLRLKAFREWYALHNRERYTVLKEIAAKFGEEGEHIYTIRDILRELRKPTAELASELSKEPSVQSEFRITEDGRAYVHVVLRVFATHLERRLEVIHKLNKEIQRRLRLEGIQLFSIGRRNQVD